MKRHINHLLHKHITNININAEYKYCKWLSICANILLIMVFAAFSYFTFFQYSKLEPSVGPSDLNLSFKNIGFFHFYDYNNYSIYWPVWLCFGIFCAAFLLLLANLCINSAYHFKLTKHKLTYFVNIPITLVTLTMIIFGFLDKPIYHVDIIDGQPFHEWGNLLTKYFCKSNGSTYVYQLMYTKIGVILMILIFAFFYYQIKVTIGLIVESTTKIGSTKHIYIVDNDNNLTINKHKENLSKKLKISKILAFISPFFTLCIILSIYFLLFYSNILENIILPSSMYDSKFIIFPTMLGTFFLLDLILSITFTTRQNFNNKNYVVDVSTTIFGGVLSSIASMIVITDFWYSRNIHQHEIVRKNR